MFLRALFGTFFISLSLSIDDLVVGVSYGLRKTLIPFKTVLMIVLGSTISMLVTMYVGNMLTSHLTGTIARLISFCLLVGLGSGAIIKVVQEIKQNKTNLNGEKAYFKWSPILSEKEAFYLGLALGVDDFAEALGLAVAGFPIIITVLLFKFSEIIAILGGTYLAAKNLSKYISSKLAFVPGITLIIVGIWQVL